MILPWMLYASLLSLLLGSAAWVLEGVVRQRGWPVRGLWTAALLGSLALPVFALLLPERQPQPAPVVPAPVAAPTPLRAEPAVWTEWTQPLTEAAVVSREQRDLDLWLLALWGAASLGITLALSGSYLSLARQRRRWTRAEVEGRPVWVSEDTGPAVVGFLPGRVVLPAWLLGSGETERRMVLAHEEEHVRARDPALLLGALLLWAMMPWNPGLWWIGQRIRRAVETDCDQRVLARGVNPRAYSRLLVDVSGRGRPHRLAVAAISKPPSFLEQRIRLMLRSHSEPRIRSVGSVLLAFVLVATACRMEQPMPPAAERLEIWISPSGTYHLAGPTAEATPLRELKEELRDALLRVRDPTVVELRASTGAVVLEAYMARRAACQLGVSRVDLVRDLRGTWAAPEASVIQSLCRENDPPPGPRVNEELEQGEVS